jgi:copper(I)-binding protein
MTRLNLLSLATAATLAAMPALAGDITVTDAYFRTASPMAKSGAAFMEIANASDSDDQLIAASSDVAKKVELHTNIKAADGVMKMKHVPEGFTIPANGHFMMARGGDHVMFMGLGGPIAKGQMVSVTLTFKNSGDMVIEIPVDSER